MPSRQEGADGRYVGFGESARESRFPAVTLQVRKAAPRACGDGPHYNSGQDPDAKAPGPALADSATIQRAKSAGVLKIGVKEDQPGLSENVGTKESPDWKGFDIEAAKKIANDLGFGDKFKFVEVGTRSREQRLLSGDVDIVVGSYSITRERKEKVDFPSPT